MRYPSKRVTDPRAKIKGMSPLIDTATLLALHDANTASDTFKDELWRWIASNHEFNRKLWDEEDLARRTQVADSEIAANKRNIDRFNQARNDATERVDECLLMAIGSRMQASARLNSETAGAMIDRLSILSLKVRAMRAQTARQEATPAHIATCSEKLARLIAQRADLAACLATLLADCVAGRAQYKIYRQFKMYNDPALNPQLYGQRG
jgi:hypothetical protein